jgi:hypothetical protein
MRHDSLYRLGGNAVLVGGILGAVAILLHAPQPMDLAGYSALSMGPWMAAHWLFVIGSVVIAGGLASFTRHLAHTNGEGWSMLGFGAVMVAAALNVAVVAPELVAFDAFRAMNADGTNVAAQHAYTAVNLNLMSLVHVVGPVFWLGVIFFGLAMLKDTAWPRWLGQMGVAIGVIEIATNWSVVPCPHQSWAQLVFPELSADGAWCSPGWPERCRRATRSARRPTHTSRQRFRFVRLKAGTCVDS